MESSLRGTEAWTEGSSWIDRGDAWPRPSCAADALEALAAVADRLGAEGDARAAFPDVYAIITRRVADQVALGPGGLFLEPRWVSRLAGRFCERYLETLRWSIEGRPQDAEAWTVAYRCSAREGSAPLANVLLGLSAHINFDLTIGIRDSLVEAGVAGYDGRIARFKHDHDAVNELLDASIPEAFARLIGRHGCPVARALFDHAYAVSRWTAMQVLTSWRARVWDDAIEPRLHRRSGRARRPRAAALAPLGALRAAARALHPGATKPRRQAA